MRSFQQILLRLLDSGRPTEIMALIKRALKVKPMARAPEALAGDLFRLAMREENGLMIAERPSYSLKRSAPIDLTPDGMYAKWTLKALRERGGQIELSELVRMFPSEYRTEAQELWAYLHIQRELSKSIVQRGALKVGLNQRRSQHSSFGANRRTATRINDNIHEANLEALIAENLENVERGLELISRQYNAPPVGRIDLLCRDRQGTFVVIEIKKFRASTESIIDQVTRYMGWVQHNLARGRTTVRGIIIVGVVDEKLSYSVRAIPNLEVKRFSLSLKSPD